MPHVELPQAEFKVVVLGDTNTGKTSLVLRFVEGYYRAEARSATVGAFFLTKRLTVDSITCKMLLWDTAGAAQFQKLAKTYYNTAAAAVLTYDVSQPGSLTKLQYWLDELQKNTVGRRIVIAIAACKCDLPAAAPDMAQQARKLAESVDAIYVETSAKDNTNVNQLFVAVAERVLQCQTEAASGEPTALPIPVTVGGVRHNNTTTSSSSYHHYSHSNHHHRASSPITALANHRTAESGAAAASSVDGGSSPHHHTDNDILEQSNNAKSPASAPAIMCEGGMLVCGSDDKGCCIT